MSVSEVVDSVFEYRPIGYGASVFSGFAFKSSDLKGEGIPVIKIGNIQNRVVDYSNTQFFPEEKVTSRHEKYFLSDGDVLIAMTGQGSVGRVGKIRILDSKKILLNQRVGKFAVDNINLDNNYLYYIISSPLYESILFNAGTGSGQPNLSPQDILSVEIPYPDIKEQKAIAATLSVLDDMIELNNQINKTLEEMAQAIFKSWFVDFEPFKNGEFEESELGLIPKGWKIVELEEICSIQNGFAFKSSDYQDTGCRLIRTTNITSNGYVNNNDIKFLPQSFYESEKYKNYRFECFDTVLVMVGASIGKIGLITEYNLPSLQNQNMWRFRANNREISSVYIHYVVRRVNEFVSNWATGSARDFYRKESFQRAKCVLPPKNVMKEFRLLTDSLFIQISSNIMENALLLEIRDILLPKLMSGEIRVPVEEVV